MKRRNIFLIAFVSIIIFLGGYLLWGYSNNDTKKRKAAHVVLVGENIGKITYENRMLSFLQNNPKYCVWYVLPDKAAGVANKQSIGVDDITDKEKVIDGIKALDKQGLALDNIHYMLVFPNTKASFTLQKELHKEFNVKAGCTAGTMEAILAEYQEQDIDGQKEVHLVLHDGKKLVGKAMAYTKCLDKELHMLYESYIALGDKKKANELIAAAMEFAKAKQYANGGLTVYFDEENNIQGIKPFSRLFPKLSYRNIFSYRPSTQADYQGRVYCSIQPGDDFEEEERDLWECFPEDIKGQCDSSCKSMHLLEDNETKMGNDISSDSVHAVPVGGQLVIHLQNDKLDILKKDIDELTKKSSSSFWQGEKEV